MTGKFSIQKILGRAHPDNGKPPSPFSDGLSRFANKISTPEEALSAIKPGDRVFLGTGCATPRTLIMALETSVRSLHDVEIYHFLVDGAIPFQDGVPDTRFFHKAFFVDANMREVIKQGKGDYIPMSLTQLPRLLENGALTVDAALIQVSMPDKHGFVSTGVSTDITHCLVRHAKTVIAELNPNMPKTCGDTSISMDQFDKAVVVDLPVIEYLHPQIDSAVAKQIARNVTRIISNGSTLQIGLGRIPNEMLKYLDGRHDIGIHTDVICDSMIDLIEKGIVTGERKSIHKGQIVASYCMGTKRLYDLIDNNPRFVFHPIEYVCDPSIIARNHKMVSVTQAWAVDLMGQACSDQFHGELYSGVSTQPDFMRGAAKSPGGKPIICLASTTDDGSESRIRPLLLEGEGVTIPRSDVHYVVTEYGTAYLFGKSIREKALALIEIAHPAYRSQLLEEAKRLGYVREAQDLKCKLDGTKACRYPVEEEREVTLKNGTPVCVRPSRASDVRSLQEIFYQLPAKDVYTRFFTGLKSLSAAKAEYLCNVDYEKEMAFVVTHGEPEKEKLVGSALYVVDPSKNTADVAYMIPHEWQGMGIGSLLQERMIEYAKSKGIRGFTADILYENKAMLKLAGKCGNVEMKLADGAYEVEMLFGQ
jgi:acyl-CoA hydrolase/RimJ/RimL family protein N-acetyltransferase